MSVLDTVNLFSDFYEDFDRPMAMDLIERLSLPLTAKFKTMSKGMKEKLQLILVMSRKADLYLLDEPIGGVDPASRDVILDIMLRNYDRRGTILLSTHLIYDIEPVLDDVVMIGGGHVWLADTCDNLRANTGMSVEQYFREVFRC
jgi:ABC-2 type transport system ATP-binding protein